MASTEALSKSAQRVQDVLAEKGLLLNVVELSASTRTAQEAAQAIGCEVAQIVKSLVFCTSMSKQAVLVLASGVNRVNTALIEQQLGESLDKADADFVREATGYAIGGIPPVGHKHELMTFIDQDLLKFSELWAAAGTPHAVFNLQATDLVSLTGGTVISIR